MCYVFYINPLSSHIVNSCTNKFYDIVTMKTKLYIIPHIVQVCGIMCKNRLWE